MNIFLGFVKRASQLLPGYVKRLDTHRAVPRGCKESISIQIQTSWSAMSQTTQAQIERAFFSFVFIVIWLSLFSLLAHPRNPECNSIPWFSCCGFCFPNCCWRAVDCSKRLSISFLTWFKDSAQCSTATGIGLLSCLLIELFPWVFDMSTHLFYRAALIQSVLQFFQALFQSRDFTSKLWPLDIEARRFWTTSHYTLLYCPC